MTMEALEHAGQSTSKHATFEQTSKQAHKQTTNTNKPTNCASENKTQTNQIGTSETNKAVLVMVLVVEAVLVVLLQVFVIILVQVLVLVRVSVLVPVFALVLLLLLRRARLSELCLNYA